LRAAGQINHAKKKDFGSEHVMKHFRHWSCAAIVASVWTVPVHAQSTVYIPDVVELSGPGAVSGTNWRDGAAMAIDEMINKSGGILGRKIETEHLDTQSNPGVSRAQIQKVLDRDPYVVLGPIYSGSVKVNMALTQQAEVPQIVGAEAADITQQGNPWVFRTAFGQQFSMPKIANYLHDQLKVKSVAVVWVNNDFGKGGHDSFVKEMKARSIDVVADRICPRSRARSTSDLTSSS
jgi:branched-chain amino acid transport system substrate-binding protein